MIPIKIQIKNFLSYGEPLQSIDFTPYHLVCLSGKNGHGKSALLDAITWTIWGQARKVGNAAKADQGLLRLGQTHMLVILDFECNGRHYRIRREFALTHGKPYAALDFGIINEIDDTIAPLTEKTIRATQATIEDTIRLDYDSFINSAFLRQGQANEFSKKSPKDRKEILANILGLQRYETLKRLAHDISREKENEKQQIIKIQEKIAIELEKRNTIELTLQTVLTQLQKHQETELIIANEHKQLNKKYNELIQLKHEEQLVTKELKKLKDDLVQQCSELEIYFKKWRSVHKQQIAHTSIDILKKEKVTLTQLSDLMQKRLQEKLHKQELYLKAQQSMLVIEQQLKQEAMQKIQQQQFQFQQLQLQCNTTEQKIALYHEQQQHHNKEIDLLENNLATITKRLKIAAPQELEHCEKTFEKRRAYYQRWIAQANMIKNEIEQTEQKRSLVSDDTSPSCPLCEQNLSATRKKFLKHKIAKNEQFLVHRYQRLKLIIQQLKQMLIDQHVQLTALKETHKSITLDQHTAQTTQHRLVELRTIVKTTKEQETALIRELAAMHQQLKNEEQKLAQEVALIEQRLKEHPVYKQQFEQLTLSKASYEQIRYHQEEHVKIDKQRTEIELKLQAIETLQQDILLQNERKKQVAQLCYAGKLIKQNISQLEQKAKQYVVIPTLEKEYITQESMVEQKRVHWNKQKEELLQESGRLEQQQKSLQRMAQEYNQQQIYVIKLNDDINDYQEIALALSKNGIQALLIEDAIPEIEYEANTLLHKLTDNQATIMIESLRDLKSGGTRETLDIKISDAVGIRPYEMFSGGEAFRIDFALRIAISKLLARRAGTALQLLVIDEGFGSQDEEGLSYIMDAIYKIQEDFKKVIIVSHLSQMKDQFPVHFHIYKNPHGSHVQIIEQA